MYLLAGHMYLLAGHMYLLAGASQYSAKVNDFIIRHNFSKKYTESRSGILLPWTPQNRLEVSSYKGLIKVRKTSCSEPTMTMMQM